MPHAHNLKILCAASKTHSNQIHNWRRKWQPTPVSLPGESHGQRSLVGYSPWGCKESDTTERLHFQPNKQKAKILLNCHLLFPPPRQEPCCVSYSSASHCVHRCGYATPSCMLGEPLTPMSALASQWSVLLPLLDGGRGHTV